MEPSDIPRLSTGTSTGVAASIPIPRRQNEFPVIPSIHDFGWALHALHAGNMLAREGWNGKGQFIKIVIPREKADCCMTLPYIYISTVRGEKVPWLASQTDILAIDWKIADV